MQTFAQSLGAYSVEQTKCDIETAKDKCRNDFDVDFLHDISHDIVNKGELTKAQRKQLQKILTRPHRAAEGPSMPSYGPDGMPTNETARKAYYGGATRFPERCLDCDWEGTDYMNHMREMHPELL